MNALLQHLIVLPVIVPLVCAAAMLFIPESGRRARVTLAMLSTLAQLAISVRKGWMPEWRRALRFVFDHRREILAERRRIQASRLVADRRLLRGGPLPFTDRLAAGGLERVGQRLLSGALRAWWALVRPLV